MLIPALTRIVQGAAFAAALCFVASTVPMAGAFAEDWEPVADMTAIGSHRYERAASRSRPDAIQKATKEGGFRFNGRKGEYSRWDEENGTNVDRAELVGWPQPHSLGSDVWVSYSQRILPGDPITSRWCVIGQMHATTEAGDRGSSPPFALHFLPGDIFEVSTRYVSEPRHTTNPDETIRFSGRIERDRWYHHVFRLRFGYSRDAIVQWWRDGVPMLNLTGISMGYNDPVGPYWQFGVYRNTSPEDLSVDYRNVEVSNSSLAARIKRPLPVDE